MNKIITLLLCIAYILSSTTVQSQIPQLWGTTEYGGNNGGGTVFKLNGDSTGYQVVYSAPQYTEPNNTLLKYKDGNLYGTTQGGGADKHGTIFNFNPNSSIYTNLYDFTVAPGAYPPDGGGLTNVNGIFYGCTYVGGTQSVGTIYKFDPSLDSLKVVYSFKDSTGQLPAVSWLTLADNGKLYGVTPNGGLYHFSGVLFSLDTGLTNTFKIVHNFVSATGTAPRNKLIEYQGTLYGVTTDSGANNNGVIYSYNIDSVSYADVYDFDGTHGKTPWGGLTNVNGIFYGMAEWGGVNDRGVIYSFNPSTKVYTDIIDFNSTNGMYPAGGLLLASDSNLYGLTPQGGIYNGGVIFKLDLKTDSLTILHNFNINDTDGFQPAADLIDYNNINATGINIKTVAENHFSIYPNPTTGNISITSLKNIDEIKVTNVLGQLVYEAQPRQTHFNFSIKENGIFFVSVTSGNETTTRKLIVIK